MQSVAIAAIYTVGSLVNLAFLAGLVWLVGWNGWSPCWLILIFACDWSIEKAIIYQMTGRLPPKEDEPK